MKVLVLDVVVVLENSALIDIHHAQDTLIIIDSEEILCPSIILLPEIIVLVPFPDLTLEVHSISETIIFHVNTPWDKVQDLSMHLEIL